ncbi:hypothetical protein NYO99_09415 [Pelomonas sp. UHG3]|uniref:Uncharacterized protein n=1 Tax=Roseateles hydrophilus TaxID=2975054 RepID=A0ACC6C9T4_9BURK|nr:hypothetical protein [Pelomonas sp. UHG3]MCY4745188.1 hypothetical protein [Pelomonas sp. UHG3]
MGEQDWARLGLDPTTDLAAIKTAYARQLKTTRPDDDAEAYQALRGAYERAQQWARQSAQRGAHRQAPPAAPQRCGTGPEPAPELAPSSAAAAERIAPPAPIDAQVLIDSLELAWRRNGDDGLDLAWAAAQPALLTQPLPARAGLAAAFARWVIRLPQLPDAFVARLAAEFGWRDDYRSRPLLGDALAEGLEEALEARWPRMLNDAGLMARAQALRQLCDRLRAGRDTSALVLMVLLHPRLLRDLTQIGPAVLRRLGLSLEEHARLHTLAGRAGLLRVALAAAAFIASGLALGAPGVPLLGRTLTWLVCSGFALGAVYTAGAVLAQPPGRAGRLLQAWALSRRQPALGLGLLAAAALLAYVNTAGAQLLQPGGAPAAGGLIDVACGLLGLAGLAGAWPRDPEQGITCVGLIALAGAALLSGPATAGLAVTVLCGAALVVLLGAAHADGRLRLPMPVAALLYPVTHALRMSLRWGPMYSLLPAAAALGYAMLPGAWVSPLMLFAVWCGSGLALTWAQGRVEVWALARLSRA